MAKAQTPEEQLQALTKQVEDLQKKSEQDQQIIAVQKGAIQSQGAELASLTAQLNKAETDLADKVSEIRAKDEEAEANQAIIAAQDVKLRAVQAQAEGGAPVVEHEGQLYRLALGVNSTPTNHDQLKRDAALAKKVVEEYPGLVQLIEEKAPAA